MDIINDPNNSKLLEYIKQIVSTNLRGDEEIIDARLYEIIDRIDNGEPYHEEIYCVAWFSPSRSQDMGRQYGTHRVSFNNLGASALCWGGYDMSREDALKDLDKRVLRAPAGVV